MTVLNNNKLQRLRKAPSRSQIYLSVYRPTTILAAQINDLNIERGAIEITFDTVSSGSWTDVESGMTLLVGTTLGGREKGKVRVRSSTSTVLTVAENTHIEWSDDLYLTVLNFFEINAVYPRIIQDPADELNVIFYKDYDIAYTDQNQYLGFFPQVGCHYAGWKDDAVYYKGVVDNLETGAKTFTWEFEGGSPGSYVGTTPGEVVYNTPGHYTTKCVISGTYAIEETYRHVSIYDKPSDGTNVPILKWELRKMSGSVGSGGYTATIRVIEDIEIYEGDLVVLFTEDHYRQHKESFGGNATNRETIFFVGYIMKGSIQYNFTDSYVEFDVGSPSKIMEIAEGFSISVEDKKNPSTWYELRNLSVKRAIYHFLKWHTTLLLTNDVNWYWDEDRLVQYFDADRTSLYDAVKTFISSAIVGRATCDRQGQLFLERDAYAYTGTYATGNPILNSDWFGEPQLDEQLSPEVSYLEMGGIKWTGDTGTFSALLSAAPGEAPAYRGDALRQQGLALDGQDDLNQLTGDVFAHLNAVYPRLSMNLRGKYSQYDIAPQERIPITIQPQDTVRNLNFNNKNFLIMNMSWAYSGELLFPKIVFWEDTTGVAASTIIIPDAPPEDGGFNQPPFNFPPIPSFPLPQCCIDLYDEGIYQGRICQLDFIGQPVTATIDASGKGVVTVNCQTDPTGGGGAVAVVLAKGNAADDVRWFDGETRSKKPWTFQSSGADYENGITWDTGTGKATFSIAGTYLLTAMGNVVVNDDNITNNPGTSFNGIVTATLYDSGGNPKGTYVQDSGSTFAIDYLGTYYNFIGSYFNMVLNLTVSAGDYITFEGEISPDGFTTNTSSLGGYLAIARLP